MSNDRLAEAARLVDQIFAVDSEVKDHESAIRALKVDRAAHEDRLRLLIEGTGVTEVAGATARAKFGIKSAPKVVDWQALYEYIKDTGAWELLHRRIGVTAWEERLNAGMYVPGVEQVILPTVEIKGKR